MKTLFASTAQVQHVVEFLSGIDQLTYAIDYTDTVRIQDTNSDVFLALRKTDYTGEEGYWICRYDPEWVDIQPDNTHE